MEKKRILPLQIVDRIDGALAPLTSYLGMLGNMDTEETSVAENIPAVVNIAEELLESASLHPESLMH